MPPMGQLLHNNTHNTHNTVYIVTQHLEYQTSCNDIQHSIEAIQQTRDNNWNTKYHAMPYYIHMKQDTNIGQHNIIPNIMTTEHHTGQHTTFN